MLDKEGIRDAIAQLRRAHPDAVDLAIRQINDGGPVPAHNDQSRRVKEALLDLLRAL